MCIAGPARCWSTPPACASVSGCPDVWVMPLPRDLLAMRNAAVLERWLEQRPSFVFDYDGTLAPMFERPHDAHMRPHTRAWLTRLAAQAPCAVLTGRPVRDAQVFL